VGERCGMSAQSGQSLIEGVAGLFDQAVLPVISIG
jgi:hypothetical protein